MTHHQLPRSAPEAQGMPSSAISGFLSAIEGQQLELHSLMLVRHGHVIAEGWWSPFSAERIHLLYSLSKAFTATAIGIAVDEGRLSVEDTVLSFFPDKQPANVSEHVADMRVHHLLSMATGHRQDALGPMSNADDVDWIAGFFSVPPDQEPGSIFAYNNAATFMLSAILQRVTGMKLMDYLKPRFFEPLGITKIRWTENRQGINLGFSGLHITTEAIARFGQLYLQRGEWQGQQLVSQQWVERAAANHIATESANAAADPAKPDWCQGYGYQFWQCRHNAYRGDGAFGQFCLIMPEQDAVLATTAGVAHMQSILDLVWAHLLPAMDNRPLPDNPEMQARLACQLERLTVQGGPRQSIAPVPGAYLDKTYSFRVDAANPAPGESVTLYFGDDYAIVEAMDGEGAAKIRCGYDQWAAGTASLYTDMAPVLSRGVWSAPDVFTVQLRYIESPHCLTFDFHLAEKSLRLNRRWNVHFDPLELPAMVGHSRIEL